MELEGKRSSISSMIAASILVTLITLSTLTIGMATPAAHNNKVVGLQEHQLTQHVDKS